MLQLSHSVKGLAVTIPDNAPDNIKAKTRNVSCQNMKHFHHNSVQETLIGGFSSSVKYDC